MFFYDYTMIIVLPAIIFAFWAQQRVSGTFNKYSKVQNKKGYTAAEVAKQLLSLSGITDVTIEKVAGKLTDHYDPRTKVLRLSDSVYDSKSLAAIGVAAHETGHAIQHSEGYMPLNIRNAILPAAMIGSNAAFPLVMIGLVLTYLSTMTGEIGWYVTYFGIALFMVVVLFQAITLPVEFNASKRAVMLLGDTGILSEDEAIPAKKVLNAAAMTYVAALVVSIGNLLRLLMIANRRRD